MTNHLYMKHIPGDILTGKHRVWPKLNQKYKRYLLKNIDREIDNMKVLAKPYITHEESAYINDIVNKEITEQKSKEKWEKIRANKNKLEDQYMSKHFENLRHHRVWE